MDFIKAFVYEWTQYDFMRTALLAVLIITPLFGILGTMVVDGRMAYFSDSLGHSAMTGIAIGVLAGLRTPLPAMIGFGIAYAVLLTLAKARGAASTDTTIGVFASTGMALGVILLSKNGGFSKYTGYLIGDLLAVTRSDLIFAGVTLLCALVFWFLFYNQMLLQSVNESLAKSRGVRTLAIDMGFACLLSVVVMLSIRWVGVLIISAMLVMPCAAARNISRNVQQYHLLAVLIAMFCGVLGLLLSYASGTASGAMIILTLAACYVATLIIRNVSHE